MNPLRWLWRQVFDDDENPLAADQLVVLGMPSGEALAGLWQSTLESAQIHSMVRNVNSIAVYGLPQWEVLVQYTDLERARELLDLHDEDAGIEES
jgi:Putative prokaryotic signal transducing protein